MRAADFLLRQSCGSRMRYIRVVLEAEQVATTPGEPGELLLDFYRFNEPYAFRAEVQFGVAYFFRHYTRQQAVHMAVTILAVGWLPADSTAALATYATIMALCEVFDVTIAGLTMDYAQDVLTLPGHQET